MKPIVAIIGAALFALANSCVCPTLAAPLSTPPEQVRSADQTFLTGPEWFLVFSPSEYADYIRTKSPSGFPFFGHISQFWQGYYAVAKESTQYSFNTEYHLMILVIGLSTTFEYAAKGIYEGIVGRFSELIAGAPNTPEDRLAVQVAQRYVSFIKQRPWYEFDFLAALRSLWTETGLWGEKPLRKWERKYFLTSEYLFKAAYGWALGEATRASYDKPIERTFVVVGGISGATGKLPEGVAIEKQDGGNRALISLPRYQAFTDAAERLAAEDITFEEVAGNQGDILVSIVMPDSAALELGGRLIYSQPILTRPPLKRFAVVYRISELAAALRRFAQAGIPVEHIYDF